MLEKNKMKFKLILSILIVFIIILLPSHKVIAAGEGDDLLTKIQSDMDNFSSQANNETIDTSEITGNFTGLAQILTMIGAGVMVAVTTYMGIKYLTEGPEAQAKLKTQLIGVVVSGIVIFGAYFIWKIVVQIASTF